MACKVDLSIVIYGVEATLRSGSSWSNKDIRCAIVSFFSNLFRKELWVRIPVTHDKEVYALCLGSSPN
jgi:hypothetical protein